MRRSSLVFVREKVRPEYVEAVPDFSPPVRTVEGVMLAPIADVVRMKLTSFRLRDQVHLKDLDAVGLITPEIEHSSPRSSKTGLPRCAQPTDRLSAATQARSSASLYAVFRPPVTFAGFPRQTQTRGGPHATGALAVLSRFPAEPLP